AQVEVAHQVIDVCVREREVCTEEQAADLLSHHAVVAANQLVPGEAVTLDCGAHEHAIGDLRNQLFRSGGLALQHVISSFQFSCTAACCPSVGNCINR